MNKYNLIDFRKNHFSQFGEDGIVEKILSECRIDGGWFVEFGAWDGQHLSNTRWLADNGWSGIFIEGDPGRYSVLEDTYRKSDRVHTCEAMVTASGPSSLDSILASTPIPKDFDVLSVDIDGNDYHVWEGLVEYSPKVVIIESNATFPFNVEFIQRENDCLGSSALSLYQLGCKKGYSLACYNDINCIFVREDLFSYLSLIESSYAFLFHLGRHGGSGGFFVSDYKGVWDWLLPQEIGWGYNDIRIPAEYIEPHQLGLTKAARILYRLIRRGRASFPFTKSPHQILLDRSHHYRIVQESDELLPLFQAHKKRG
ncbi:MAG: hypothetical protein KDD55_12500 [Bdellovibrionales bacterium]|nr:hypothetical protein [Bdellovibrionales bacterium]